MIRKLILWWKEHWYFGYRQRCKRSAIKFAKYNFPAYKVWYLSNSVKTEMVVWKNIETMYSGGWLRSVDESVERFGKWINDLPSVPL